MKTGICGYKYFFEKSYKVPVGNYSYYPDKMVLDKSKIIFESIEIEFKHNKEYTTIEILSNKRVSESRAENIIRAVSLMTGQVFTPFCKMTFNDDCVTSKIYKKYSFKQIHNMFSYIFMNESISNYIAKAITSGVDLHDFLLFSAVCPSARHGRDAEDSYRARIFRLPGRCLSPFLHKQPSILSFRAQMSS